MRLVVYHYLNGNIISVPDLSNDGPTRHMSEVVAGEGYSIGEEWYEEEAP